MNAVLRTVQRSMNFDILDACGKQIHLRCNNLIDNGNVKGNHRKWYTLSGNVTQNGGAPVGAQYRPASWRIGAHPFNQVECVTVNPLKNNDVDVYID